MFQGSDSFLLSFKKRHRIVGRKITQVVSLKKPHEQEDVEKLAKDFVDKAKITIDNKLPKKVRAVIIRYKNRKNFDRYSIVTKWVFNLK